MSKFDELFAAYLAKYQAMSRSVRDTKSFGSTIDDHIESKQVLVKYVHGLEKKARVRIKK